MISVQSIIHRDHYRTVVHTASHELIADEPVGEGGTGLGPAPASLLAASLGSCTCITLRMYADRKGIPLEKAEVLVSITRDAKMNLTHMERKIQLHGPLSDAEKERLLDIANHCPIHKMLTGTVLIKTDIV